MKKIEYKKIENKENRNGKLNVGKKDKRDEIREVGN